ncbi:MAG: hypothetical protein H7X70_06600, partial [Candidatus Kapabacteria bacterium]|nr:hypothetical protein [Candidatus Kapabacteria bacterium]
MSRVFHWILIASVVSLVGCIKLIPTGRGVYYVKPNIDTVTTPVVNIAALRAAYPNDRGVLLGYRVRGYEQDWIEDQNYLHIRSERYVILDAKADDLTNISESFHEAITMAEADVLVFHPDGTREQYGLKDFTVTQTSKRWRSYRLPIKNATAGTVVDMCWVLSAHNSMVFTAVEPSYLRHPIPSLEHDIEYQRPSLFMFQEKELPAASNVKPDRFVRDNVLVYRSGKQPAARNESFSPVRAIRWARLDYCAKPVQLLGYMSG